MLLNLQSTNYPLFLENINVSHDSCFSFVSNHSIWRFDKRIGDSRTLGNGSYPLFFICSRNK
uniref:Uncharacterized protein n=1 Tax=Arundo donax TaxID=35708 RepID=A0A0A9DW68_ARUDO